MPAVPVVQLHVESYYRVGVPRPILSDISWRVLPGEHWVVVGANGSGKSTLLSMVSGERWPSRGEVSVLGQLYGRCDKRELRKRIGVVTPVLAAAFPRGDTAVEVAASGLRATIGHMGRPAPDVLAQARRALERVAGLAFADKPFGVLSQGERQRAMIARALIAEPGLLILDEPCSGLDPVARERFLEDLARLGVEPDGPTQIHVTHHLEEVPAFITHALLIAGGRVSASGPVEEVLTSERLADALGAPCHVGCEGEGAARRFSLAVR